MKRIIILVIVAVMAVSCNTVKKLGHNMDSNYRAKSGKAAAEKKDSNAKKFDTRKAIKN